MDYDIVPRPKKFQASGSAPIWPVDAILATVNSGDAVRVPHAKRVPGKSSARGHLLSLIREGLKRRGFALEWAPDGDEAVTVWAVRVEAER